MRCPKCGYISFDHVDACEKCKKDLSALVAELDGSTYAAEVPRFLVLQGKPDEGADDFSSAGEVEEAEEIVLADDFEDADLDVLVEDDDADIELDDGPEIVMDDDAEIAFDGDLQEVEEAEDFNFDESEVDDSDIAISIPDELADVSDLAAPEDKTGSALVDEEETVAETVAGKAVDSDRFDKFDLDDLRLELDSLDEPGAGKNAGSGDFELSLDDIDFSETVPETVSGSSKSVDPLDMDAELDFELDLGGLTLHNERK